MYEKSILGCGLWSGLDCGKKGAGLIISNFWGMFFHFFGVKKNVRIFFENTIAFALKILFVFKFFTFRSIFIGVCYIVFFIVIINISIFIVPVFGLWILCKMSKISESKLCPFFYFITFMKDNKHINTVVFRFKHVRFKEDFTLPKMNKQCLI